MKHGHARDSGMSPSYQCWLQMRDRCNNPNNSRYHDYGGRGIYVCKEWDDFLVFFKDMGEHPKDLTLDRIDNNGPYCKANCKWSTRTEQQLNKRKSKDGSNPAKGVSFGERDQRWMAYGDHKGSREYYKGNGSLFEAVAWRKSWEIIHGVKSYE